MACIRKLRIIRAALRLYILLGLGPGPGPGVTVTVAASGGGGKYIICIKIDDVFVPFLGLLGICDKCGQGHDRAAARSCALLAYRFLQDGFYVGFLTN